jgi:hypothetical protein
MIRNLARVALAVPAMALISSSTASAAGIPGFDGKARLNSQTNCFIESWGSALNNCLTDTDINFSLPVNSSGYTTARFYTTASAVSSANTCRTYAVSPSGGVYTGTFVNMQVGTGVAIESTVYVSSWGAMWGVCTVPAGAKILHVHN